MSFYGRQNVDIRLLQLKNIYPSTWIGRCFFKFKLTFTYLLLSLEYEWWQFSWNKIFSIIFFYSRSASSSWLSIKTFFIYHQSILLDASKASYTWSHEKIMILNVFIIPIIVIFQQYSASLLWLFTRHKHLSTINTMPQHCHFSAILCIIIMIH